MSEFAFAGCATSVDVNNRVAELRAKGVQVSLLPMIVSALLADHGGEFEVSERAMREAIVRAANPADCQFVLSMPTEGGMKITMPDLGTGTGVNPCT